MSDYIHGAYGDSRADGNRVSTNAEKAIVCIGTAPVHTLALATGESYNVNKPVLVHNIAEAKAAFGYNDDWAKYTLCEVMHHFFETKGIGPLVFINVLDPATHKASQSTTVSKTPVNNSIVIASAGDIILDSITVASGQTEKTKGTDYTVSYNATKKQITIMGITNLGTSALTITYDTVTPASVTSEVVIGSSDGAGTNTGIFAIKNVYPLLGVIPAFLMAPGFTSVPAIHSALIQNSRKINGHWDAWVFADLPLTDGNTAITMDTAATYKNANGFNRENETACFPMAEGTDDKYYHLSTIRAANFLELLAENDGVPYHSASNTDAPIIKRLYMGTGSENKIFDDEIINEKLNKNGIASAAFVGGRWAIWGAHAADYNQDNADNINVAETNRMMLFYVSNDFQARRPRDVDKPLSGGDLASMVAEEQQRLDALKAMGALLYGEASLDATAIENSDVYSGDFAFEFRVTTTPLAKSLKAIVAWVDDGYSTYFTNSESDVA